MQCSYIRLSCNWVETSVARPRSLGLVGFGIDVAFVCQILKPSIEVFCIRDDLVFRRCIVVDIVVVVRVWRFDVDGTFLKFLVRHRVQRKGANRRVWVLLSLREEGDKAAHVFLKLTKIERHIVFVELNILVVLHVSCHSQLKM